VVDGVGVRKNKAVQPELSSFDQGERAGLREPNQDHQGQSSNLPDFR